MEREGRERDWRGRFRSESVRGTSSSAFCLRLGDDHRVFVKVLGKCLMTRGNSESERVSGNLRLHPPDLITTPTHFKLK